MLGDHINLNLKRGVRILTCDPSQRLIEAETRNGEVISINAYSYTPVFRWPVPGEKWVVREENGSWYLDGIYEIQGPAKAEIRPEPGDIVLSAASGRTLVNKQGELSLLSTNSTGWINVKEYGATGNGITDDTKAIKLAMEGLGTKGTLLFPTGTYVTSEQLNFDSTQAVIVKGSGGISANGGASVIKYIGESASSVVSARSSIGFAIEDMGVAYTNAAFTGQIIDLSALGTVGSNVGRGRDTAQALINKSFIGSFGHHLSAENSILMDNSNQIKIRDSFIGSGKVGVLGRATKETHAVNISINGCQFLENEVAHTKNAGGGWSIIGCSFEATGTAPFVYTCDTKVFSKGMAIIGNWMGDAVVGKKQVNIDWAGSGLVVEGNLIGGQKEAGSIGILLRQNGSHGIVIRGNCFEELGIGIKASAEGLAFFDETGNDFINVTTQVVEPGTGWVGSATIQSSGGAAILNKGRLDLSEGIGVFGVTAPTVQPTKPANEAAIVKILEEYGLCA